ncbi:nucleotide sugar dehydrogenase [Caulobacter sp. BK020]|uniref:nucleotide sugar dehydrogenase n=1 Tax=Caulobacter sp. BK020 TaxID=2512117 RepID=UPI0010E2FE86|nr:nucleotide sugar dehydrogenase [Caulobacter sp. BK020]TCS16126.1 UDP-N-acetyl-D-glucosamine dehydrogenase [Caulobacter sp. BK020]
MNVHIPTFPLHAADDLAPNFQALTRKILQREAVIGVVGMGYVGLPLSEAFCTAGFRVIGFDLDETRLASLSRGASYLNHFADARVAAMGEQGFVTTSAPDILARADAVLICVPTPITSHNAPDLGHVVEAAETLADVLRPGQLVVLESTTFPGATTEVLKPILERSGLRAGRDFALAFSPEREDPGNPAFTTASIPKIVGADSEAERRVACALYDAITVTVPVGDTRTAEAVKLTENVFRFVNIALANELKVSFEALGIDIWEVIQAAQTKPFGYMPFFPGPGVGGHCIPVDPFYLAWRAKAEGASLRMVELAGEISRAMPRRVVDKTLEALAARNRSPIGAHVLVVGVAYKRNVDDTRETPARDIIEILRSHGARVSYHDPLAPELVVGDTLMQSIDIGRDTLAGFDCAIIVTDHDALDYGRLVRETPLVIDTRNAAAGVDPALAGKIVKA